MMVGTMAEGETPACVRVTPRFSMAACRRGPPDPHPLARTEQPGLIGTSQPSLTLPTLPGTSCQSSAFRVSSTIEPTPAKAAMTPHRDNAPDHHKPHSPVFWG
jgi:hypothetical protein